MWTLWCRVLIQLLHPVHIGTAISEIGNILCCKLGWTTRIHSGLIIQFCILPWVCDISQSGRLLIAYLEIIRNLNMPSLAFLCGNKHYAIGSARTIDSGRRSILQDRNLIDIIGIQIGQRTFDTINDNQWVVIIHGVQTTNIERGHTTRGWSALLDNQTSSRTLQCLQNIRHRFAFQLIRRDRRYGTSQIDLLLHTIAHHNDILQKDTRLQHDIYLFLIVNLHFLGFITHIREYQSSIRWSLQWIVTVKIGHGTVCSTFHLNSNTNDSLAISSYVTCNSYHSWLCECWYANQIQQYNHECC